MKNLIVASFLALSAMTATVQAADGGFQNPHAPITTQPSKQLKHGGFINNQQSISKVADSKQWKDDEYIVLEGNIIRQVGKEDFIFKDNTGEIEVEIDRRAWNGQTITPQNTVRLYAEVDKSWNKIEIEVNRVEKIK